MQRQLEETRRALVFTATGQVSFVTPPSARANAPASTCGVPYPRPPPTPYGALPGGLPRPSGMPSPSFLLQRLTPLPPPEPPQVLFATHPVAAGELPELAAVSEDFDRALQVGITLEGRRYEVHRHHSHLIYGRTLEQDPTQSEGVAICRSAAAGGMLTVFVVITYRMPHVSAKMVSKLDRFCRRCVEPLGE